MVIVRRYTFDLEPGMLISHDRKSTLRIGAVTTLPDEMIEVLAVNIDTGSFTSLQFGRREFVRTHEPSLVSR